MKDATAYLVSKGWTRHKRPHPWQWNHPSWPGAWYRKEHAVRVQKALDQARRVDMPVTPK